MRKKLRHGKGKGRGRGNGGSGKAKGGSNSNTDGTSASAGPRKRGTAGTRSREQGGAERQQSQPRQHGQRAYGEGRRRRVGRNAAHVEDVLAAVTREERTLLESLSALGLQNADVQATLQRFVTFANEQGMQLLVEGEMEGSRMCLDHADRSLQLHAQRLQEKRLLARLKVLTLNNTACWHKHGNDLVNALAVLQRAEQLCDAFGHADTVTYSNMCAVFSQMQRHDEAAAYARRAVRTCKRRLRALSAYHRRRSGANASSTIAAALAGTADSSSGGGGANASRADGRGPEEAALGGGLESPTALQETSAADVEKAVVALGVACYNLAVELEFQGDTQCIAWYKRSVVLAEHGGGTAGLVASIREAHESALAKYAESQAALNPTQQQDARHRQQRPRAKSANAAARRGRGEMGPPPHARSVHRDPLLEAHGIPASFADAVRRPYSEQQQYHHRTGPELLPRRYSAAPRARSHTKRGYSTRATEEAAAMAASRASTDQHSQLHPNDPADTASVHSDDEGVDGDDDDDDDDDGNFELQHQQQQQQQQQQEHRRRHNHVGYGGDVKDDDYYDPDALPPEPQATGSSSLEWNGEDEGLSKGDVSRPVESVSALDRGVRPRPHQLQLVPTPQQPSAGSRPVPATARAAYYNYSHQQQPRYQQQQQQQQPPYRGQQQQPLPQLNRPARKRRPQSAQASVPEKWSAEANDRNLHMYSKAEDDEGQEGDMDGSMFPQVTDDGTPYDQPEMPPAHPRHQYPQQQPHRGYHHHGHQPPHRVSYTISVASTDASESHRSQVTTDDAASLAPPASHGQLSGGGGAVNQVPNFESPTSAGPDTMLLSERPDVDQFIDTSEWERPFNIKRYTPPLGASDRPMSQQHHHQQQRSPSRRRPVSSAGGHRTEPGNVVSVAGIVPGSPSMLPNGTHAGALEDMHTRRHSRTRGVRHKDMPSSPEERPPWSHARPHTSGSARAPEYEPWRGHPTTEYHEARAPPSPARRRHGTGHDSPRRSPSQQPEYVSNPPRYQSRTDARSSAVRQMVDEAQPPSRTQEFDPKQDQQMRLVQQQQQQLLQQQIQFQRPPADQSAGLSEQQQTGLLLQQQQQDPALYQQQQQPEQQLQLQSPPPQRASNTPVGRPGAPGEDVVAVNRSFQQQRQLQQEHHHQQQKQLLVQQQQLRQQQLLKQQQQQQQQQQQIPQEHVHQPQVQQPLQQQQQLKAQQHTTTGPSLPDVADPQQQQHRLLESGQEGPQDALTLSSAASGAGSTGPELLDAYQLDPQLQVLARKLSVGAGSGDEAQRAKEMICSHQEERGFVSNPELPLDQQVANMFVSMSQLEQDLEREHETRLKTQADNDLLRNQLMMKQDGEEGESEVEQNGEGGAPGATDENTDPTITIPTTTAPAAGVHPGEADDTVEPLARDMKPAKDEQQLLQHPDAQALRQTSRSDSGLEEEGAVVLSWDDAVQQLSSQDALSQSDPEAALPQPLMQEDRFEDNYGDGLPLEAIELVPEVTVDSFRMQQQRDPALGDVLGGGLANGDGNAPELTRSVDEQQDEARQAQQQQQQSEEKSREEDEADLERVYRNVTDGAHTLRQAADDTDERESIDDVLAAQRQPEEAEEESSALVGGPVGPAGIAFRDRSLRLERGTPTVPLGSLLTPPVQDVSDPDWRAVQCWMTIPWQHGPSQSPREETALAVLVSSARIEGSIALLHIVRRAPVRVASRMQNRFVSFAVPLATVGAAAALNGMHLDGASDVRSLLSALSPPSTTSPTGEKEVSPPPSDMPAWVLGRPELESDNTDEDANSAGVNTDGLCFTLDEGWLLVQDAAGTPLWVCPEQLSALTAKAIRHPPPPFSFASRPCTGRVLACAFAQDDSGQPVWVTVAQSPTHLGIGVHVFFLNDCRATYRHVSAARVAALAEQFQGHPPIQSLLDSGSDDEQEQEQAEHTPIVPHAPLYFSFVQLADSRHSACSSGYLCILWVAVGNELHAYGVDVVQRCTFVLIMGPSDVTLALRSRGEDSNDAEYMQVSDDDSNEEQLVSEQLWKENAHQATVMDDGERDRLRQVCQRLTRRLKMAMQGVTIGIVLSPDSREQELLLAHYTRVHDTSAVLPTASMSIGNIMGVSAVSARHAAGSTDNPFERAAFAFVDLLVTGQPPAVDSRLGTTCCALAVRGRCDSSGDGSGSDRGSGSGGGENDNSNTNAVASTIGRPHAVAACMNIPADVLALDPYGTTGGVDTSDAGPQTVSASTAADVVVDGSVGSRVDDAVSTNFAVASHTARGLAEHMMMAESTTTTSNPQRPPQPQQCAGHQGSNLFGPVNAVLWDARSAVLQQPRQHHEHSTRDPIGNSAREDYAGSVSEGNSCVEEDVFVLHERYGSDVHVSLSAEERKRVEAQAAAAAMAQRAEESERAAERNEAEREARVQRIAARHEAAVKAAGFSIGDTVQVQCHGQWLGARITAARAVAIPEPQQGEDESEDATLVVVYDVRYASDGQDECRVALSRLFDPTSDRGEEGSAGRGANEVDSSTGLAPSGSGGGFSGTGSRGVTPIPATDTSSTFEMDQEVRVRFRGRRRLYPARIAAVHPHEFYDVEYLDGDRESNVPVANIVRMSTTGVDEEAEAAGEEMGETQSPQVRPDADVAGAEGEVGTVNDGDAAPSIKSVTEEPTPASKPTTLPAADDRSSSSSSPAAEATLANDDGDEDAPPNGDADEGAAAPVEVAAEVAMSDGVTDSNFQGNPLTEGAVVET